MSGTLELPGQVTIATRPNLVDGQTLWPRRSRHRDHGSCSSCRTTRILDTMSVIPITSTRINSRSTSRDPDPPLDLHRLQAIALQHPYSTAFLFGSSLTIAFCSGAWLTKRLFFPSRATLRRAQVSRSEMMQIQNRVMERLDSMENRMGMQLRMVQPDKAWQAGLTTRLQRMDDILGSLGQGEGSGKVGLSSKARSEVNRVGEDELKIMEEIHFARPKTNETVEALNAELAYLFGTAEQEQKTGGPVSDPEGWRAGTIDLLDSVKEDVATIVKAQAASPGSSPSPGSSMAPASALAATAAAPTTTSSSYTAGNPDKGYAVYKRPPHLPFGGLRMGLGKHGPMPIVDPSNPNYM